RDSGDESGLPLDDNDLSDDSHEFAGESDDPEGREDAPVPYRIDENNPECSEGQPFAVVEEDGDLKGCHATREEAEAQIEALMAAENDDDDDTDEDSASSE